MTKDQFVFAAMLFAVMFISVWKHKLTFSAALTACLIGCAIFIGAGFTGIAMIGLFFLLGTLATSWKLNTKETLGAAETDKGRRKASQVFANGGVAGIAGLLSFIFPQHHEMLMLMMAGGLAAATADTLSSELGTVYGKKFYNLLSFKNDRRGENGVVSAEGSLFGLAGSALIAAVYAIGAGFNAGFAWIIIAGTVGNIADSVLGATLERKQYLNNDMVNLLNTLVAAGTAFVLAISAA